jgi:hypothetical protein
LNIDPYVFNVATCSFINADGAEIYCTDAAADGRISVNNEEAAAIERRLEQCNNK